MVMFSNYNCTSQPSPTDWRSPTFLESDESNESNENNERNESNECNESNESI